MFGWKENIDIWKLAPYWLTILLLNCLFNTCILFVNNIYCIKLGPCTTFLILKDPNSLAN